MRHCIFFLLFLSFVFTLSAQNSYLLDGSESEIIVKGTSNVHDWHMAVNKLTGEFGGFVEQNELRSIASGKVECLAVDLKSDSKMMDGKALDALKGDNFPNISFTFSTLVDLVSKGGTFSGKISGNLSVAGKTNSILVPCKGTIDSKGDVFLDGSVNILMSQFAIKPPTAMFGTISCGDPLTLEIKIKFIKVKR